MDTIYIISASLFLIIPIILFGLYIIHTKWKTNYIEETERHIFDLYEKQQKRQTFIMHSEFLFLAINTISENICRKEQIEDDLLSIYTALKLLQTKKAAQIAYKTFGKLYKRIILTVCWFIDNDISIKESIDYYIDNTARIKDANMYLTNHPLNHISDINE